MTSLKEPGDEMELFVPNKIEITVVKTLDKEKLKSFTPEQQLACMRHADAYMVGD